MGAEPEGEAMLAERSSMPAGVGGDTDDAGDVDVDDDSIPSWTLLRAPKIVTILVMVMV